MVDSKYIIRMYLQNKMAFLNLRISASNLLLKQHVYNILKYDFQILIEIFTPLNSSGTNSDLNDKKAFNNRTIIIELI